jgi:AAA family ATP:ADP antiporter
MTLYLMSVLFAYYILKASSRGLFLAKFDIDKLPGLYVLIALFGGVLTYFYTKIAIRSSLKSAVLGATIVSVTVLLALIPLLRGGQMWTYYFFNIWVSLFSIMLVSQGWLIAGNVFTTREAKRLYGILGVGSVIGAAFGGTFAAWLVGHIGVRNLLYPCAAMVLIAYGLFRLLLRLPGVNLDQARGADEEEAEFSLVDVLKSVKESRHLQVIVASITITYVVDVMVEYQFSAMAKEAFKGDPTGRALTAFLGNFYGLWLNLVTFFLQLFLTSFVASRFGVGGTLQIMPVTLFVSSIVTYISPGVISTAGARLAEAATRYSFNRTGMELLYLPLPMELRNRVKAFLDIVVDRLARGLGGAILIVITTWMTLGVKEVALAVLALTLLWMLLSWLAQREYVATVRNRLAARRLDLENVRVAVTDVETVRLLEQTARSPQPRQAAYALSLLTEVQGYNPAALLASLPAELDPAVRAPLYKLALSANDASLKARAEAELATGHPIPEAIAYLLAQSGNPDTQVSALLDHENAVVAHAALDSLVRHPNRAQRLLNDAWLNAAAAHSDPQRRALAATAVRIRGDAGTSVLHQLLADTHPAVISAALAAAGQLGSRTYLEPLINRLAQSRFRGDALRALAAFGDKITGSLADLMNDHTVPVAIRRQIPRVLRRIPSQRSVDALLAAINARDLTLRATVLRSLNGLREEQPQLTYGAQPVLAQIHAEAKFYYEMSATLAAFEKGKPDSAAAKLLIGTLQDRLSDTISRLFRLLGLQFPPTEIYSAYLAVRKRASNESYTTALEFLDQVLDRDLKRAVLPLLDNSGNVLERGKELYGVERPDAVEALRRLIASGDNWLVCCAMATAGEWKMKQLADDIRCLKDSGEEVCAVATQVSASLAAL